jgi:hypothetical protein
MTVDRKDVPLRGSVTPKQSKTKSVILDYFVVLLFAMTLAISSAAHAACTNPAGNEGALLYNDRKNILQYCDNTNWIGLNGATSSNGGCINPTRFEGAIVYNADHIVPQICAGNTWVALGKLNGAAGSGGCSNPVGAEGKIVNNNDTNVMQYCDGSAWKHLYGGSSSICNTLGDVCADGTVYAGLSGASTPMYVTRCDAGMTWDGASCTGTRLMLSWNNENTTGYVDTSLVNGAFSDGQSYTAALIAQDSDSGVAGQQLHKAAQYCADLVMYGYDDWYLPALNELVTIWGNRTGIGGFSTVGSPDWTYARYWSSSEHNVQYGLSQNGSNYLKYYKIVTRCARR